jgi:5-hydroxyisourate hydrolase-like protein (transthyretin family)
MKPAFYFFFCCFFACFQYLQAQNVLISTSNNPNEPSIKMDPKNPSILVAGANINNYYFSSDTGHTWTSALLTSTFGVWGDPVIDVDTNGHFYFFHLSNPASGSWIDRIVCQKSTNQGSTWSAGTFTGLNGSKAQDKEWSVIDKRNNHIYLTWTQFDDYGSANLNDSSVILFSKSIDGGNTWSPALRINKVAGNCVDDDNTVEGATPAVGPNGEIYVAWTGPAGLVFDKSLDGGQTWLSNDILIDAQAADWDFGIPGIQRANGLPVLKCDLSGGPNHGTLYVNWSDQRNGINNTDIFLSKSTDGGNTWSPAKKVNTDNTGRHQFFSWMDIDQTNGNLHFVFYDRRNYSNTQTDVFLAHSKDGGQTFKNEIVSESSFTPSSGIFFGDYTNITVHNNIVRPIWTRLQGGALSIWTDVTPRDFSNDTVIIIDTVIVTDTLYIIDTLLQIDTIFVNDSIVLLDTIYIFDTIYLNTGMNLILDDATQYAQYPNPVQELSYVSFKMHETASVSLTLYDMQGRLIKKLIDNEKRDYGKYIVPINVKDLQLSSGIYPCKLEIGGKEKTLHVLVE